MILSNDRIFGDRLVAASLFGWSTEEVETMTWYVYILNGDGRHYVGFTSNIKRRILEHKRGHTHSTKRMGNLKLIFYEAFINESDARKQEKFYKTGYGREILKQKLEDTLRGL